MNHHYHGRANLRTGDDTIGVAMTVNLVHAPLIAGGDSWLGGAWSEEGATVGWAKLLESEEATLQIGTWAGSCLIVRPDSTEPPPENLERVDVQLIGLGPAPWDPDSNWS